MAKGNERDIQHLANMWLEEFSRAVGMFSGQAPEIHHRRLDSISIPRSAPALWVNQVFAENGSFAIWFGAQESAWMKLGELLGESTPEGTRSTYLEIINQAHQGFAGAINSTLGRTLSCNEPEISHARVFDPSNFIIFEIELSDSTSSFCFALELAAAAILDDSASEQSGRAADSQESAHALASLLPVKLNVSVSIGQSELELKRVLQAGPRSVIVLNKDVTDPATLLIEGRMVAQGEIVLANGNFGFRVKQIFSRQDRLGMFSGELTNEGRKSR